MNLLPNDLTSFVWGAIIGGLIIVLTSIGREIGKDIYSWLKSRFSEPEPLRVSSRYVPEAYPPGQCAWVREENIPNHEEQGSFFYPHPKNRGGKCY